MATFRLFLICTEPAGGNGGGGGIPIRPAHHDSECAGCEGLTVWKSLFASTKYDETPSRAPRVESLIPWKATYFIPNTLTLASRSTPAVSYHTSILVRLRPLFCSLKGWLSASLWTFSST